MREKQVRLTEVQMKAAVMKIIDMGYTAEVRRVKDKYVVLAVNRKKIRIKLREGGAPEIDTQPEDGEGDAPEDEDVISE